MTQQNLIDFHWDQDEKEKIRVTNEHKERNNDYADKEFEKSREFEYIRWTVLKKVDILSYLQGRCQKALKKEMQDWEWLHDRVPPSDRHFCSVRNTNLTIHWDLQNLWAQPRVHLVILNWNFAFRAIGTSQRDRYAMKFYHRGRKLHEISARSIDSC